MSSSSIFAATSLKGSDRRKVKREESVRKQTTKISIIETVWQDSELSIRPDLIARKTQSKLLNTINTHTRKLKDKEEAKEYSRKWKSRIFRLVNRFLVLIWSHPSALRMPHPSLSYFPRPPTILSPLQHFSSSALQQSLPK